ARAAARAGRSAGAGPPRTTSSSRQPTVSTWSATRATERPASSLTRISCRPPAGPGSASLCRSSSSRVIDLSSGSDAVVGAVEGQHGRLVVHDRLEVDGSSPDVLYVRQDVGRLVEAEFDAVVLVLEEQFAAVAEVSVYYI